jgi:hypothetical protein
VLLGAAALWLGLFAWFRELHNVALDAIADWMSPERVSGWVIYLAICAIVFVPIAKRLLRRPLAPASDDPTRAREPEQ